MKKFLIGLTIATSFISAIAFGRSEEKNPNPRTLKTFQAEFKNATNVKWEEGPEIVKARFNLNNFLLIAFFNTDGELVGTARTVLFDQLPLCAMTQISNRFGKSGFYDIVEYA